MGLLTEMLHDILLTEASNNDNEFVPNIPYDWHCGNTWRSTLNIAYVYTYTLKHLSNIGQIISLSRAVVHDFGTRYDPNNGELINELRKIADMKVVLPINKGGDEDVEQIIRLNTLVGILMKNDKFNNLVKKYNLRFDFYIGFLKHSNICFISRKSDTVTAQKIVDEFNSLNLNIPTNYRVEVLNSAGRGVITFYLDKL